LCGTLKHNSVRGADVHVRVLQEKTAKLLAYYDVYFRCHFKKECVCFFWEFTFCWKQICTRTARINKV